MAEREVSCDVNIGAAEIGMIEKKSREKPVIFHGPNHLLFLLGLRHVYSFPLISLHLLWMLIPQH